MSEFWGKSALLVAMLTALALASCKGQVRTSSLNGGTKPLEGLGSTCVQTNGIERRVYPLSRSQVVQSLALVQAGGPASLAIPDNVANYASDKGTFIDRAFVRALYDYAKAFTKTVDFQPFMGAGCSIADDSELSDACVAGFIDKLSTLLYRGKNDGDHKTRLAVLYAKLKATVTPKLPSPKDYKVELVRLLAQAMIQSPYFILRAEIAETLDSMDIAGALSFLFAGRAPTTAMLDFARANDLRVRTNRQAFLDQFALSGDTTTRTNLPHYLFSPYFSLARLDASSKDAALLGPLNYDTLRASMAKELDLFLSDVFWSEESSFAALFTSRSGFVDSNLAQLYGVSSPSTPFAKVELPPERTGILSRAGVLSLTSDYHDTALIKRAIYVMTHLSCINVSLPPANTVLTAIADEDTVPTTREKLQLRTSQPNCVGCHNAINPHGYALESYDAVGRFRTTENGAPIDPSGTLIAYPSLGSSPFANLAELSQLLARAKETRACFAKSLYAYTMNADGAQDTCYVDQITEHMGSNGNSMRGVLLESVLSDYYITRR